MRLFLACLIALALLAQGAVLRLQAADDGAQPLAVATAVEVLKLQALETAPAEAAAESQLLPVLRAPVSVQRGMEAPGNRAPAPHLAPYLDGIERPPRA